MVTLNDATIPPVSNLAVVPVAGETSRLRVSWDSVTGADEYRVEYKTGSSFYAAFTRSDDTADSETITGLMPDTTYTVKVTAVDTDADPDEVVAEGEAGGTTLDAMGAVGISQVSGSVSKLSVSWPVVNEAAGYRVEWKASRSSSRCLGWGTTNQVW